MERKVYPILPYPIANHLIGIESPSIAAGSFNIDKKFWARFGYD